MWSPSLDASFARTIEGPRPSSRCPARAWPWSTVPTRAARQRMTRGSRTGALDARRDIGEVAVVDGGGAATSLAKAVGHAERPAGRDPARDGPPEALDLVAAPQALDRRRRQLDPVTRDRADRRDRSGATHGGSHRSSCRDRGGSVPPIRRHCCSLTRTGAGRSRCVQSACSGPASCSSRRCPRPRTAADEAFDVCSGRESR